MYSLKPSRFHGFSVCFEMHAVKKVGTVETKSFRLSSTHRAFGLCLSVGVQKAPLYHSSDTTPLASVGRASSLSLSKP